MIQGGLGNKNRSTTARNEPPTWFAAISLDNGIGSPGRASGGVAICSLSWRRHTILACQTLPSKPLRTPKKCNVVHCHVEPFRRSLQTESVWSGRAPSPGLLKPFVGPVYRVT